MDYKQEIEKMKNLFGDPIVIEVAFSPIYSRIFDDRSPNFENNSRYNLMFLKQTEAYANQLLKARGHLFLNEVYDMLGLSHTKTGAITGWKCEENNMNRDNFVEFNIVPHPDIYKFIIDFNVDGVILDYLSEEL